MGDAARTITVDLDTGDWIGGGPITPEQGARVAASVLPGKTPEQVSAWYYQQDETNEENRA